MAAKHPEEQGEGNPQGPEIRDINMRGRDRRMTIYGAYCMPGTTWAMHIISSLTSYSHMVGPLSPILQR